MHLQIYLNSFVTASVVTGVMVTELSFPGVWSLVLMNSIHQRGEAVLLGDPAAVCEVSVGAALVVFTLFAISRQPVSEKKLAFSVRNIPFR